MRVFVTGATGFIGTHVVKDLVTGGHKVLGLARTQEGEKALAALGAEAQRGSLEDRESLRKGALNCDAVIHLAFIHDFSKFQENCAIDKRAIETIGSVLAWTDKPFIVTAGTSGIVGPGQVATEKDKVPADFPYPRMSEQTALALTSSGVKAAVMRLPQVHNTEKQGLVSYLITLAKEKRTSAYVGEGQNRWAAAHVLDVARLYKLALERHESGARYHAVAEEGVPMREIAQAIGKGMQLPVESLPPDRAAEHFGWLSMFASHDLRASSIITRTKLGWSPNKPGLIASLEQMNYSRV